MPTRAGKKMSDKLVVVEYPLEVRASFYMKDGIENSPALTVSTDNGVGAAMVRIAVPSPEQWHAVTLRARVPERGYAQRIRAGYLMLDGVTTLRTQTGLRARKGAGHHHRSLAALFAAPGAEYECRLDMTLLRPDEQSYTMSKGTVWVRARSPILIDGVQAPLNMTVARAEEHWRTVDAERTRRTNALMTLVDRWQALFQRHPATFDATRNINCFVLRLADGRTLPSPAYMMQPAPAGVSVRFFENALDVVLARESLSRAELVRLPTSDRLVCSVAVQMLCLWSNYVPYVSDQAWVPVREANDDVGQSFNWARMMGRASAHHIDMKHFPMEEFELAEVYGADDCEGVGFIIVRFHRYLLNNTREIDRSPALNHLCRLLSMYIPLLLLCGVTTADLGGDYAALKAANSMGAHMFALFVPVARMARMMERCRDAAPTPSMVNAPLDYQMALADSASLPLMLGEGTGLLSPIPLNLPENKQILLPPPRVAVYNSLVETSRPRQKVPVATVQVDDTRGAAHWSHHIGTRNPVYTNNSLALTDIYQHTFPRVLSNGVRKWYTVPSRPHVTGHFYRTAHLALTPYYGEHGTNAWSFVFMQRGSPNEPWTAGCTIADLLSEGDEGEEHEVCAWTEDQPTEQEVRVMRDEMQLQPRPPALEAPPATLGANNSWDPTEEVPTRADHERMAELLRGARFAALRAEMITMLEAIEHGAIASFVGIPHLLSACECERQLADALLAEDHELATRIGNAGWRNLVERYRDVMHRTSQPPDQPDLARAQVVEVSFNYQQWLERGAAFGDQVVGAVLELDDGALVLPAGLCARWERVTASVGGLMPRLYTLIEYR